MPFCQKALFNLLRFLHVHISFFCLSVCLNFDGKSMSLLLGVLLLDRNSTVHIKVCRVLDAKHLPTGANLALSTRPRNYSGENFCHYKQSSPQHVQGRYDFTSIGILSEIPVLWNIWCIYITSLMFYCCLTCICYAIARTKLINPHAA